MTWIPRIYSMGNHFRPLANDNERRDLSSIVSLLYRVKILTSMEVCALHRVLLVSQELKVQL